MSNGTPAQPWYTSKTLWTLVIGFVFNILQFFRLLSPTTDVNVAVNGALAVLAVIFRWTADQPLTVSGGQKL